MALGEITKQLALQALGNVTTPTPVQPETLGAAILSQIQAMQKALKEDQELLVLCQAAAESLQLVCKVIKAPGTPPNRIIFKTPKSS